MYDVFLYVHLPSFTIKLSQMYANIPVAWICHGNGLQFQVTPPKTVRKIQLTKLLREDVSHPCEEYLSNGKSSRTQKEYKQVLRSLKASLLEFPLLVDGFLMDSLS